MSFERENDGLQHLVAASLEAILRDWEWSGALPGREDVIWGSGGLLDSFGMVAWIAEMEERIRKKTGVDLVLADETALSREKSPFRTRAEAEQTIAKRVGNVETP